MHGRAHAQSVAQPLTSMMLQGCWAHAEYGALLAVLTEPGDIIILEEATVSGQKVLRETARALHEGCRALSFGPPEQLLQLASAGSNGRIRCSTRHAVLQLSYAKAESLPSKYEEKCMTIFSVMILVVSATLAKISNDNALTPCWLLIQDTAGRGGQSRQDMGAAARLSSQRLRCSNVLEAPV